MATSSRRRLCDGCRQIVVGPCPTCTKQRRVEVDRIRGNSTSRGYGSRWRNVIRPAFLRDHPLCVICGALAEVPDHWPETRASLVARGVADPDDGSRLRALCKICHDIHGLSYKPWATKRTSNHVTLVAGPPCAGKNTYVREQAQPGDVIVDYDEIMVRLSGQPLHHHDEAHIETALAERDRAISQLLASGRRGWIIASAPTSRQRHQYGTQVVVVLPSQAEAIRRCRDERPDGWERFVREWYQRYETDERDVLANA